MTATETKAAHTPGPWTWEIEERGWVILAPDSRAMDEEIDIAHIVQPTLPDDDLGDRIAEEYREMNLANAAFIVRACNAHYELLRACEDALIVLEMHYSDKCGAANSLRAALASAKGEQP